MKLKIRSFVSYTGALLIIAGAGLPSIVSAFDIIGAGATFPFPVYGAWAEAYKQKTGNSLNYQSIGSGGGIKQIQNKTVDFGASDMPLAPDALDKDGLMQFPTVIGGDVPVVNLKGIKPGELKLSGTLIADIFLGKITKWNDPAISALNPGVNLPDLAISVVHRADGSGTTFIWTNYLSKKSPIGRRKSGKAHLWPGRPEWAEGQRRCCGLRAANYRRDRLRRVCLRAAKQNDGRAGSEPQGRVRQGSCGGH